MTPNKVIIISVVIAICAIFTLCVLTVKKLRSHFSYTDQWIDVSKIKQLKKQHQDFAGVYIFRNINKSKYYVGQSIHVFERVVDHLNGHGNFDIYFDMRHNDKFEIQLIKFNHKNKIIFKTLNAMEKYYIEKYDACVNGYNKTKGNK